MSVLELKLEVTLLFNSHLQHAVKLEQNLKLSKVTKGNNSSDHGVFGTNN